MNIWNPGRPLTAWEDRMKRTRTDLWEAAFGGVYRFLLTNTGIDELESKSGPLDGNGARMPTGLCSIAADTARPDAVTATRDVCANVIRLALIGGGIGVVDGQRIAVDATVANRIMAEFVEPAPVAEFWPLACKIVNASVFGRAASEEELENFAIPSPPPVVPSWALSSTHSPEPLA